jgi:nuclear GTP-binding protein
MGQAFEPGIPYSRYVHLDLRVCKILTTTAFHANINNSFGKGSLIALLRQFSSLHNDRKQISVGMVGYPNTGKSSIINTLRKKKVCVVAPIAGETKVWQYITLMKRIYMIDCPGIVPPNQSDTDEDLLLRGSVRVENVEYPAQYIDTVLKRVQPKYLQRTYELKEPVTDAVTFLEIICRKSGRLLKGGEADIDGAAKMVLNDWYVILSTHSIYLLTFHVGSVESFLGSHRHRTRRARHLFLRTVLRVVRASSER